MTQIRRKQAHPWWYAVVMTAMLTACSGEPELAGSCATGMTEDGVQLCIDYYDDLKIDQKRQVCSAVMRGAWSDRACATDAALGGCRAGANVVWFLPSPKHPDAAAARAECSAQGREFIELPG